LYKTAKVKFKKQEKLWHFLEICVYAPICCEVCGETIISPFAASMQVTCGFQLGFYVVFVF